MGEDISIDDLQSITAFWVSIGMPNPPSRIGSLNSSRSVINVHFLQNNVCSFEKSSNSQIHSSGSHHPDKKIPQANFPIPSTPYLLSSLSIASDS